jgi:hypothetical protein
MDHAMEKQGRHLIRVQRLPPLDFKENFPISAEAF